MYSWYLSIQFKLFDFTNKIGHLAMAYLFLNTSAWIGYYYGDDKNRAVSSALYRRQSRLGASRQAKSAQITSPFTNCNTILLSSDRLEKAPALSTKENAFVLLIQTPLDQSANPQSSPQKNWPNNNNNYHHFSATFNLNIQWMCFYSKNINYIYINIYQIQIITYRYNNQYNLASITKLPKAMSPLEELR